MRVVTSISIWKLGYFILVSNKGCSTQMWHWLDNFNVAWQMQSPVFFYIIYTKENATKCDSQSDHQNDRTSLEFTKVQGALAFTNAN